MTQVLEYIKQNYTLFLFGAIIILLAVIGYYADKTNFGQKNKKEKSVNEVSNDITDNEKVLEIDKTQELDKNLDLDVEENVIPNSKEQSVIPISPSVADTINKELNLSTEDILYNVEKIKKEELESKKKEEEFAKFSDEFDALLPKKEIINDDLLSEIDDLELAKTQKFSLKDLKPFDNIKLPKISDTVSEEQEIWKL